MFVECPELANVSTPNGDSQPFLLKMRERINGGTIINPQCSDDPTYMGATQTDRGDVNDYESD